MAERRVDNGGMCAHNAAGAKADEAKGEVVRRRFERGPVLERLALLTGFEAVALAVAAALHLSGLVSGRSSAYDADSAGLAEALIGAVLAATAVALWRGGERARTAALCAIGFSIVGFLFGLSITLSSGHLPDIAFHVIGLTLLVTSFVVLLRTSGSARRRGRDT